MIPKEIFRYFSWNFFRNQKRFSLTFPLAFCIYSSSDVFNQTLPQISTGIRLEISTNISSGILFEIPTEIHLEFPSSILSVFRGFLQKFQPGFLHKLFYGFLQKFLSGFFSEIALAVASESFPGIPIKIPME